MMDLKQPRHPVTRHLYLNVRGIKTGFEKNEEKMKGGVYNHLSEYDVMKLRAMRP